MKAPRPQPKATPSFWKFFRYPHADGDASPFRKIPSVFFVVVDEIGELVRHQGGLETFLSRKWITQGWHKPSKLIDSLIKWFLISKCANVWISDFKIKSLVYHLWLWSRTLAVYVFIVYYVSYTIFPSLFLINWYVFVYTCFKPLKKVRFW